jgi:L-ribulose-5-phosphate 4-epimerase
MIVPFLEIRAAVAVATVEIDRAGLVLLSFGNASSVDRAAGVFAIKPSGVPCAETRPDDVVVVSLVDGRVVEGSLRPSSDMPTHLELYRRFPAIGGIVHTHSSAATAWAQARRPIPCLGTTHADFFDGPVPVTRDMTADEIGGDYEANTGSVIVGWFDENGLDPAALPGVLVASHGPFTWGASVADAVEAAIGLEAIAARALDTLRIAPDAAPISAALLRRHHDRKHGPRAYYGQASSGPRAD